MSSAKFTIDPVGFATMLIRENEALKARVAELEKQNADLKTLLAGGAVSVDVSAASMVWLSGKERKVAPQSQGEGTDPHHLPPPQQVAAKKGFFEQLHETHADVMANKGEGDE